MDAKKRSEVVELLDTLSGESMNYQTAASRNSETEHYSRRMRNCKKQILKHFDELKEENERLVGILTRINEKLEGADL